MKKAGENDLTEGRMKKVDYCLCYFVLEGEWKKKGRDFIRPKTKAKPEAFSEAFPFLIFWQQCVSVICVMSWCSQTQHVLGRKNIVFNWDIPPSFMRH